MPKGRRGRTSGPWTRTESGLRLGARTLRPRGGSALALLVVLSAFLHALWNALVKREKETDLAGVGVLAVAFSLAALVSLAVTGTLWPRGEALLWGLAAGAAEGVYFIALLRALAAGPLSVAYPISRGVAVLGVFPVSILLLGEVATPVTLLGAALVVGGVFATSLSPGARLSRETLGWSVACGLAVAAYHLAYKKAATLGAPAPALIVVSLGVGLLVNLARLRGGGRRALARLLRERWPAIGAAGAVCATSFLIFLVALAKEGAGAVLTLRNTSVLFALGLAFALGERPTRLRVVGALAIAVGAAILSLRP